MKLLVASLIAFVALVSLVSAGATPPPATSAQIKVATFNVLAPSWCDPAIYPTGAVFTPSAARINRGMNFSRVNFLDVDFYALQETEVTINSVIAQGLGNTYQTFHVYHDDSYWASYITAPNPPFARNGVSLAINKNKYDQCVFVDRALGTGNHAAVAICRNKAMNRWFRFVSVHFDSDTGGRRGTEANAIMDYLASETSHSNYIDVIAGDFNADTDAGVINSRITGGGFLDIPRAVGVVQNTHPYSTKYNSNPMYGRIDHIMARASSLTANSATIYSSNLYTQFPDVNGKKGYPNEVQRILRNLEFNGSDHFPVVATFTVR